MYSTPGSRMQARHQPYPTLRLSCKPPSPAAARRTSSPGASVYSTRSDGAAGASGPTLASRDALAGAAKRDRSSESATSQDGSSTGL